MRLLHLIRLFDLMNYAVPAQEIDLDRAINQQFLLFPLVTFFTDQFAHINHIRSMLHIQSMTVQPQLAMAHEVVIYLRTRVVGRCVCFVHHFKSNYMYQVECSALGKRRCLSRVLRFAYCVMFE